MIGVVVLLGTASIYHTFVRKSSVYLTFCKVRRFAHFFMETLSTVNRIKELAKAKGMSQAFLCAQLGLRRGYLGECVAGKDRLTIERLSRFADILDTTVEYLTGETDEKQKKPLGDTEGLSEREKKMLEVFHSLTKEQQDLVLALGNK